MFGKFVNVLANSDSKFKSFFLLTAFIFTELRDIPSFGIWGVIGRFWEIEKNSLLDLANSSFYLFFEGAFTKTTSFSIKSLTENIFLFEYFIFLILKLCLVWLLASGNKFNVERSYAFSRWLFTDFELFFTLFSSSGDNGT